MQNRSLMDSHGKPTDAYRIFFLLGIVLGAAGVSIWPLHYYAFLRAIAVTAVILSTVQPWKVPVMRSTPAWCVWTAHWLVILSVWLVAIFPRYRVDFLHILFIGGFTLLILAVGTRVTLRSASAIARSP